MGKIITFEQMAKEMVEALQKTGASKKEVLQFLAKKAVKRFNTDGKTVLDRVEQ